MDIALIDPKTGVVENVIVCDSIEDAQKFYPDHDCVERKDQPFEAGAKWDGKTVTAAPIPDAPKVDPKDELIAALMAKLGM